MNEGFGYIISISGKNFNPHDLFKKSVIQPDVISEINNGIIEIQFCDLRSEPYPLDMLAEAIEYIVIHIHYP